MKMTVRALFGAALLALPCSMAALAADKVNVGTVGNSGDVGFYVAQEKGYFAAENLDVTFNVFDSAAKMIAPLGTTSTPSPWSTPRKPA